MEDTQPTITPEKKEVEKRDFLPMFAGGFTHEDMATHARENGYTFTLLPEDKSFEKYASKGGMLEGITKDKFHEVYQKAHDSYGGYATTKYNGSVAPFWQYDKPELKTPEYDESVTGGMPEGVDKYGRIIATRDELAASKGFVVDTDGKKVPYSPPGFLQKLANVPIGIGSPLIPSLAPLLQGDDPSKVRIIDQDEYGNSIYRNVAADDPKVLRSQIASSWGPQSMTENWYGALLKGVYNGLVGVQSMVGSVMEQSNKFIDFMTTGKDSNSWLEREGRVFQNLSKRSQIPVGMEAQGSMFSSFSAAAYSIGSLIPIVLLTRGAGGAMEASGMFGSGMAAEASAHGAATFALFTGMGMDSYTEAGKENGVDPADLAWQVMLAGPAFGATAFMTGPTFLSKGLMGAELKAQTTKLISNEMKSYGLKWGTDFALLSPELKLRFVKGIGTPVGKLLLGAHGMGTMMASGTAVEAGVQTLNDLRALSKNPNAAPGKGQFDKYDANKSFISNVIDRLPNKMMSSYVSGFFSGLLYSPIEGAARKGVETLRGKPFDSPGLFSKMPDITMENISASGKTQDALKISEDLKNKSFFGRETHDKDGNPITEGSDAMTENESRYQAFVQELQYTDQISNMYADPAIRSNFGNNIGLLRDVIVNGKTIESGNEALKTESDPEKIKAIQEQQETAKQRIKDITTKEDGTDFSKAYNDLVKSNHISLGAVIDKTDEDYRNSVGNTNPITEENRKSKAWRDKFEANLKDDNLNRSYEASKVFSTDVDKEIARRKEFNQKAISEEQALTPVVQQIREEIRGAGKLTDDVERLNSVRKITGMINDVSSKIDMSRQLDLQNEFLDLKGKLVTEAGDRQKFAPVLSDSDVGYVAGLSKAYEGTENLFENKQNLLSTDKEKVISDMLSGDIANDITSDNPLSISNMSFSDTSEPTVIRQKIKDLQDKVEKNKMIVRSAYLLGAKDELKPHLSPNDITLSEDQGNKHLNLLNRYYSILRLYDDLNESKLNNHNDKYFIQGIDKAKRDLENIAQGIVSVMPEYNDLVKAIPSIPEAWKEMKYTLSDGERKKLHEANRQIVEIKSRLFELQDKIIDSPEFEAFISDLVLHRHMQGIEDTYLNTQFYDNKEYKSSLDALYQLKPGDDYLTRKGGTSVGYINTINSLIETFGVHAKSMELARLKAFTETGESVDPLIQGAQSLAFSFMVNDNGNAHKILGKVVEAESKYLTTWKGVGIQAEVDAMNRVFMDNSIFIGGDSGTGKSTSFLKGLYDLHSYYSEEPFSKDVVAIGVSVGNEKSLGEGLSGIKPEYLRLEDVLNSPDLIERVKRADHIIIDESQRLSDNDIILIKNHFGKSGTILFLGDIRQGTDNISKVGAKSLTLTERKNNNNPLVNVLHDVFRGIGDAMPNGFVDENGNGIQYFKDAKGVVDAFYADPSGEKALILNPLDYEDLTEEEKKNPNIFVLDKDIQDNGETPKSIRGSIFKKVYIGFERNGNDADYYTATGRASDFVALPDRKADDLNKGRKEDVSWVETPAQLPDDLLKRYYDREIDRLRTVTGDQTTGVKPVEPVKGKTDPDQILPVTVKPTAGDVFKTIDPKGYARIVSVGKDGISLKVVVADTEAEVKAINIDDPLLKPSKMDISGISYIDTNHRDKYVPKPVGKVAKGKTSAFAETGESYAYTHYTFGSDVSAEDHTTKQDITKHIHALSAYFNPELVYLRSQDMTDPLGNKVTMNDVLSVRFTFKDGAKKAEFLDQLKRSTGSRLSEKAFAEIEKSVNETGELPEKFRYLMMLDQPHKGLSEDHNAALKDLITEGRGKFSNDPVVLSNNIPLGDDYKVYSVTGKNQDGRTKYIPVSELIGKMEGKVVFGNMATAKNIYEKGTMRQKLIIQYDPVAIISESNYIILRTLKMSEVAAAEGKSIADILKAWKDTDTYLTQNGEMDGTMLFNFIHNNRAQFKNKEIGKIIGDFGKWEYDTAAAGYRLKLKKEFANKEGYAKMFDRIIERSSELGNVELPFDKAYGLSDILSGRAGTFLTNTLDLLPHTSVFINDIKPGEVVQAGPESNPPVTFGKGEGSAEEAINFVNQEKEKIKADKNEKVPAKEYKEFVDNNVVSDKRLNTIADKLFAGETLTTREQSIRAARTSEVESLLQDRKNDSENISEEQFPQWAVESKYATPNDLIAAYDQVVLTSQSGLQPWQERLEAEQFSYKSYVRFGDENTLKVEQKSGRKKGQFKKKHPIEKNWLLDKSNDTNLKGIDLFVNEENEGYNSNITPDDVIDFINSNPDKSVFKDKVPEIQKEISRKYKEKTGMSINEGKKRIKAAYAEIPDFATLDTFVKHNGIDISTATKEELLSSIEANKDQFQGFPFSEESYNNLYKYLSDEKTVLEVYPKSNLGNEGGAPADGNGEENGPIFEESRETDTRRISRETLNTWLDSNVHPDIAADIRESLDKHGIGFLNIDGKQVFGYLHNGRIRLEMQRDGIVYTSPKHEFFHMVYNYFLDEPSKGIIMNESKTAMKRYSPQWRGKKITDLQAEEWIAHYIGKTGIEKPFEKKEKSPWYTPKGIFQAFMDMVNKMFGRYQPDMKHIDNLIYDIDHGRFKDQMPDLSRKATRTELDPSKEVNKVLTNIEHHAMDEFGGGKPYHDLFLDRYFKKSIGEKAIDLNGTDYHLYSAKDRQEYVEGFDKYQSWLKGIADMPKNVAIGELEKIGVRNPGEFYDSITDNMFVRSFRGNSLISETDPKTVEFLQDEFKRLPEDLQSKYAYQILLTNGLESKQGSAINIIPKEFYDKPNGLHEQSTAFGRYLDGIGNDQNEYSRLSTEMKAYAGGEGYKRYPHGGFDSEKTTTDGTMSNTSTVKPLSPYLDVINGFYSPVEKAVLDIKAEKLTGNKWLEQLRSRGVKGDELTYTGLDDMLKANPSKTFSRGEIQQWMKDNRIDIREVSKGDNEVKLQEEYDLIINAKNAIFSRVERDSNYTHFADEIWGDVDHFIKNGGEKPTYIPEKAFDQLVKLELRNNEIRTKLTSKEEREKSQTKYSAYQLPGDKENYKEVLITLPPKEPTTDELQQMAFVQYNVPYDELNDAQQRNTRSYVLASRDFYYRSSHFDEHNILAHLRLSTRVDVNGKKVLFVDEIQSDWGQKGKKEGFKEPNSITELPTGFIVEPPTKFEDYWKITAPKGYDRATQDFVFDSGNTKEEAIKNALETLNKDANKSKHTHAPFVTETTAWTKLGLKVALKQAIKEGAESISWTTGEQQNERYDLSKKINEIHYSGSNLKAYDHDGNTVIERTGVQPKDLPDIIGKDVAEKLMAQEPKGTLRSLTGQDIKVGGKGMIGFYGSPAEGKLGIVGQVAEGLWGKGSVKTKDIGTKRLINENDFTDSFVVKSPHTGDYQLRAWNDDVLSTIPIDVGNQLSKEAIQKTLQEIAIESERKINGSTTQHSIDITPKMRDEVAQGLPLFQKPIDLNKIQDNRVVQQSFEILLDKIKGQFEQLNFIKEDSDSLREKGISPTARGYVDGQGIHYNIDKVTSSTGVHELQHIWNAVYKSRNPEKYAEFENYVKDAISQGGNDVAKLSEQIKITYPELDGQQHIDEVMATMGGFTSIPAVERFLRESDSKIPETDKTFATRIYENVKRYVTELWNGLKGILGLKDGFDIGNPDLEKFFKDFTNQVLKGDKFTFTPDEMKVIDKMGKAESRSAKMPVLDISDLTLHLASDHADSLRFSKLTPEEVTDEIFNEVKKTGVNARGNYYYNEGTHQTVFPADKYDTDEKLKEAIHNQVTPKYPMIDGKVPELIQNFISFANTPIGLSATHNSKQATISDIASTVGLKDYNPQVLKTLINLLGIEQGAMDVVRYSQLPEHADPRFRSLYKDDLKGYDPIVVVHGFDKNGKADVSIFDVTSYGQGTDAVIGRQRNILGDIMDDKKYRKLGGPAEYNDSMYSYRKLMIGMQALGMDATFRKLSVIETRKNSVKPYQVNSIEDIGKILDILKAQPEFMDMVGSITIRGIIQNKRIENDKLRTPFINQLSEYLSNQEEMMDPYEEFDTKRESVVARRDLLTKGSKQAKIKALTEWQRVLDHKIGSDTEKFADPIYQLVSATLDELKRPGTGFGHIETANQIADIKGGGLENIPSPLVQRSSFIQASAGAMQMSIERTVSAYWKYHEKIFPLLEKVVAQHGIKAQPFVGTAGNLYFDHLYKDMDVVAGKDLTYGGKSYKKGDKVTVRGTVLHMDKNDPETKPLYDKGKITDADLELTNAMYDEMRKRTIADIYWQHQFTEIGSEHDDLNISEFTWEDAEQQFNDMNSRAPKGHIPVIDKSANEMLMQGKFKEGLKKYFDNIQAPDQIFTDVTKDKSMTKLFSSINQQMLDPSKTHEKIGLVEVRDGNTSHFELFDPDLNEKASHDIEKIGNYFMLKGIRDEMIGNEFLPEYNTQMALMTGWENSNNVNLRHTREFMEEYFNRYVNKQNADKRDNGGTIDVPLIGPVETADVANTAMRGMTNILLMYRFVTAPKVLIAGAFKSTVNAIAQSAANIGMPEELRSEILPTMADHLKAAGKMFSNRRKVWAIARKFHYWNQTEDSLLHSPMENLSVKKNALSAAWGMLPDNSVDQTMRVHSLVSQLIHNGAWEAYSVDAKSGDLAWDRFKDKRYFNSDGSQSAKQKAMYNALTERLKSQGEMSDSDIIPDRGDDWDIVNNHYKWYASQFVYVGIDDATKALMTNGWKGKMVGMFRMFMMPHLNNLGVNAKTGETIGGGRWVPYLDEEGNTMTKWEMNIMEGHFQSWRHVIHDLRDFKNMKDPLKYWQSLPTHRRINLGRSLVYAGALAGLVYFIGTLTKKDQQKYSYLYSELMLGYASEEWMKNPIPILGTTLRLTEVGLGQKKFSVLAGTLGVYGGYKRAVALTTP